MKVTLLSFTTWMIEGSCSHSVSSGRIFSLWAHNVAEPGSGGPAAVRNQPQPQAGPIGRTARCCLTSSSLLIPRCPITVEQGTPGLLRPPDPPLLQSNLRPDQPHWLGAWVFFSNHTPSLKTTGSHYCSSLDSSEPGGRVIWPCSSWWGSLGPKDESLTGFFKKWEAARSSVGLHQL